MNQPDLRLVRYTKEIQKTCVEKRETSIADIYGVSVPETLIPEGYEYVDFRPPRMGEFLITRISRFVAEASVENYSGGEPRVIVAKKKVREWLVREAAPTNLTPDGYFFMNTYARRHKLPNYFELVKEVE